MHGMVPCDLAESACPDSRRFPLPPDFFPPSFPSSDPPVDASSPDKLSLFKVGKLLPLPKSLPAKP